MIKPFAVLSSLIILALALLSACTEQQATPLTLQTSPSPIATAGTSVGLSTATLAPVQPVTTPNIATAKLPPANPSPTPTVPQNTSAPTATALVAPTITPASDTASAQVTPGAPVPILPVKRTSGTLTIGLLSDDLKSLTFSPYQGELSEVTQHFQRLVWNARLLYRDPVQLTWRNLAARTLPTVSADGRRFTFVLRDELVWSDGSPITVADYLYAFNIARRPETRYPRAADLNHLTIETNQLDPKQIIFQFDDRYATALEIINLLEPLPSLIWSKYSPDKNPELTQPSVTSGPYLPDTGRLNFKAVPKYVLGQPNFERLNLKTYKYMADLKDAFRSGQLNWTFSAFTVSDQAQLNSISGLKPYRWLPVNADRLYLGYNLNNPVLQSKVVRHNLNRLLDVRSLIFSLEQGHASDGPGFLPAGNEYASKLSSGPLFNPRQAREDLKTANYNQSDQSDLLTDPAGKVIAPLNLIYSNDLPQAVSIGVYVQQQYRQLGLRVVSEPLDPTAFQKRRTAGKFDLEIGKIALPEAFDPDDYKAQYVTGGPLNFYNYSNPQVDNLFGAALRLDPEQRSLRHQFYDRLQLLLQDDAPVFSLYTLQAYTVMNQSVDPGGAGALDLAHWLLTWDAFPAYLNWYLKDAS